MSGTSKMGSRLWELYSSDIILYAGAVITLVAVLLSVEAGVIVGYIWLAACMLIAWSKDLPPFSWFMSDGLKLALVILAPLTAIGILIGGACVIIGLPFLMWHDGQKKYKNELRQVEEGNKNARAYKPRWRNYLIGGFVYYLCLAGVLFGIWLSFKPS